MKDDQFHFFQILGKPPARLNAEQAAWALNFSAHDVPLLVAAKLLRPLGDPQPNAVKYFSTKDVLEKASDSAWLARATTAVSRHWQQRNARKRGQVSLGDLRREPAPTTLVA